MTEDQRRAIPFAVRAAIASVAMAIFLIVLKSYAAWSTGSIAMLGSLADSGLDLLASAVTLYGVRLAAQPADHDHRFGHGKAEALAALFQVMLITASAAGIAWRAIVALGSSEPTQGAEFGIGVSLYFSSQGAARVGGPVLASTARLLIVAIGGGSLMMAQAPAWTLFALVGGAMAVFGLSTAGSVAFARWGK